MLGPDATITAASTLGTLSNVLKSADLLASVTLTNLSLEHSNEYILTRAVLNAPSQIGGCTDLVLNGGMSQGNGGRPFTYLWALDASKNVGMDAGVKSVLETALQTAGSVPVVMLPRYVLTVGCR